MTSYDETTMHRSIREFLKEGKPVGRPLCRVRHAWAMRFDIRARRLRKVLPDALLKQLSGCKDDSARRLILGISEKGNG